MKLISFSCFLLLPFFTYSQSNKNFEHIYQKGEIYLYSSYDSCLNCVENLKKLPNTSNLQKIKIVLLETQANCQLLSIDSSRNILNGCLQRLSILEERDEKLRAELLILLGSINSANSNISEGIPQLISLG